MALSDIRPLRLFREILRSWGARWDGICRRCGICCYERTLSRSGELVVNLSSPCEHLDPETRLCLIYRDRFRLCPDCRRMTIFHARFSRYLPPSCGYVRKFRRKKVLSGHVLRGLPEEPGNDPS